MLGPGDVLVRVLAAGLHIGDWHMMTGLPYLMRVMGFGLRAPKTQVRGMDVAGVVEAVGPQVTRLAVGDEVYGVCGGAFAEYAATSEKNLTRKPESLTFEEAAVLPTSASSALQAVRDVGSLKQGQSVLVIGASGGVGLFAVQIAKALGGVVTGVCRTAKVDMVRAAGADHVVDYSREDVLVSGQQFDLIIDTGGNRPLAQLRRALTPAGTLVIVGSETSNRWISGMDRPLQAMVTSPFVGQRLRMLVATSTLADLDVLTALVEGGSLRPLIDRTYPLQETREAMRYLMSGQARGKIAVTV